MAWKGRSDNLFDKASKKGNGKRQERWEKDKAR
jgi:hypothetical protein